MNRIFSNFLIKAAQQKTLSSYVRCLNKADPSVFRGSRTGSFLQEAPKLGNQYLDDFVLKSYLQSELPTDVFAAVNDDLIRFGDAVANEVLSYHNDVCLNEPVLEQYNAWGERVDNIIMHPSWKALHNVAAREKLISIPYENEFAEYSRLYQTVKLYLYSPSSGLYSCPLAMTDGAAKILKSQTREPFNSAFRRLTSNDPDIFWTSGQWMTEKRGGSDVGNGTETLAVQQSDGTFKLYGYKWFTSATDANMSLTLARILDQDGNVTDGSKGLTMFYLETRNTKGQLNGLKIEKFKKKLGTRQMPTAEIILDGAIAHQLSDEGRGIASISKMINVSRIHNAIMAVSNMRRLLNLSKDFSKKRKAFGSMLCDLPLHVQTLTRLEVEHRAGFLLLMKVSRLLGLVENKKASDKESLLLRLLTPLLKLYTGKQSVAVASEGLESFGGHGYLEDTGLPVFLRDAQVLSIWEGTTNVLALDVLRSITKSKGEVLQAYFHEVKRLLSSVPNQSKELQLTHKKLSVAVQELQQFASTAQEKDDVYLMVAARDFSYSLARTYMGCLLFENAVKNITRPEEAHVSFRWSHGQDLVPVTSASEYGLYENSVQNIDRMITYGTHDGSN